jgi:uncharacterized protein
VELLDSLRGFAILGILVVNSHFFFAPIYQILGEFDPSKNAWYDSWSFFLIRHLAQGKFYAIFSMLFGAGMMILYERCRQRGTGFISLYSKRMFTLMLIGGAHGIFLWSGDILFTYGLLGLGLMLVHRLKQRWLLLLVVLMGLMVMGLFSLGVLTKILAQSSPQPSESLHTLQTMNTQALLNYNSSNFGTITQQRWTDFTHQLGNLKVNWIPIMFFFLTGAWAWNQGVLRDPAAHRGFWKYVFTLGMVLGTLANAFYAWGRQSQPQSSLWHVSELGYRAGQVALSYGYCGGFALLACSGKWSGMSSALAKVGRLALTHYLIHSLVFTTLAYGYGLSLFGKMNYGICLLLAIVTYVGQIYFSGWWLSHFRNGPVEWLWRRLTYGKTHSIKREPRRSTHPLPSQLSGTK